MFCVAVRRSGELVSCSGRVLKVWRNEACVSTTATNLRIMSATTLHLPPPANEQDCDNSDVVCVTGNGMGELCMWA